MNGMTELEAMADGLNRLVKIALDTGEASTIEEAERIFAGYRMQIVVGPDIADSAVLQAALLTAVNSGARAFLGGVSVVGARGSLLVLIPGFDSIENAVAGLGGRVANDVRKDLPTLVIGTIGSADLEPLALRVTFADWCGGSCQRAADCALLKRVSSRRPESWQDHWVLPSCSSVRAAARRWPAAEL